jgi:hypothetical protein
VLLDSVHMQQAANQIGDLNVLTVVRFHIAGDTAMVSAVSHRVWQQRRGRGVMMGSMSACEYRLRRSNAMWQVDSTVGCVIT